MACEKCTDYDRLHLAKETYKELYLDMKELAREWKKVAQHRILSVEENPIRVTQCVTCARWQKSSCPIGRSTGPSYSCSAWAAAWRPRTIKGTNIDVPKNCDECHVQECGSSPTTLSGTPECYDALEKWEAQCQK